MKAKIAFVSLGCDKNRVDSEVMLGILAKAGLTVVAEESAADLIVINTCCFIQDALEESIEAILEMAEYKKTGNCKGIIVAGCLGQRYQDELYQEMPEVDAIVGTAAYEQIAQVAEQVLLGRKADFLPPIDTPMQEEHASLRVLSTAGYFAYLKISEGCDNHCTYCVIPKLRGRHRSRTLESLIQEAEILAQKGVKELILVAQDTSIYGRDLYGESRLPQLLRRLCAIEGLEWIRILYCYPETLTDEVIQVMKEEKKICHYLDMPIQHASNSVLKRMGRGSSKEIICEKIEKLRSAMPDIALRTTLIVGFPGETEEEFEELMQFVEETKFARLGVFTYSQEEGTPAGQMENQIPEEKKLQRKEQIMELQKSISAGECEELVGKELVVLTEGKLPEESVYCARSFRDAPDIDGLVFVQSKEELYSGDFVRVKITEASDYDLVGEVMYGTEFSK